MARAWQAWLFRLTVLFIVYAAVSCCLRLVHAAHDNGLRTVVDGLARSPLSSVVVAIGALSVLRLAVFPFLASVPVGRRGGEFALGKTVNEFLDALVYAGIFVFMIIRPFGVQAFLIPSASMWPTLHVNDFIVANKAIYRYTDPKDNDVVVFRPPARAVDPKTQLDSKGDVNVDFIKRLIGSPGEIIEVRKGVLYRNGRPDPLDNEHKHLSKCAEPIPTNDCQEFSDLLPQEAAALTNASFKLVMYEGRIIPLNYTDADANSGSPIGGPNEVPAPYQVAHEYEIDDPSMQRLLIDTPAQPVPPGMYLFMGDNRNGSYDSRGWGLVPRESIIGRAEFVWFPWSRIGLVR